jgi:arsenate reductase (thioredoxin)
MLRTAERRDDEDVTRRVLQLSANAAAATRSPPESRIGDASRAFNVLFLCTGNSARSIFAEVIMNRLGNGRFVAFSAGSMPTGRVHPFAIDYLRAQGLPVEGLRSKSWDEFTAPDAPAMKFVITVCDNATGEVCPVWPGQPITARWGVPDPAAMAGTDEAKRAGFRQAFQTLRHRVGLFTSLLMAKLERQALAREMQAIGTASP